MAVVSPGHERRSQERLEALVSAHGGDPANVHAFDLGGPALLSYASLGSARLARPEDLGPILGVYEWQGAPLLLLVDGDRVHDEAHMRRIVRVAALRGDLPYLGVLSGGRLDVRVVGLKQRHKQQAVADKFDVDVSLLLPYVAAFRPNLGIARSAVSDVVLKLLDGALTTLTKCGLSETDAISLSGRALFARFLADRDLPLGPHMVGKASDGAFADAEKATLTSDWLDATFNGNLLPISEGFFERLPQEAFGVLIDIMRRAPDGQMSLGWESRWDNLHFAHIPVGILSQVYERYLKKHEKERQRREGSYYTPAFIADLMVQAALAGLPPSGRPDARFLDPAAGAGVFLITAFRHLVAERWTRDGARPDTKVLREILYGQIAGFDVNEAALRFAALGLYLVSIELDPEPEPVSKLRFDDLRDTVLFRPTTDETIDSKKGAVPLSNLGSLGPGVPQGHSGRYDVVIGNPPWKTGSRLVGWQWVEDNTGRLVEARLGVKAGPILPNEALDLPFVWRATEWARPDGQIALALHGRLLFQKGDGMPEARKALFRALDVTSVVNGAGLRKTRVWPQVSAPFALLFARNRKPTSAAALRFVSPCVDTAMNRSGVMRIDASHAPFVRLDDIAESADRLKILFRGSELDLQIYERIVSAGYPSLVSLTKASGYGLQASRLSSSVLKGQTVAGADASYLKGRPYLSSGVPAEFIDVDDLPIFHAERIHRLRPVEIFEGPLLILGKTIRAQAVGLSSGVSPRSLVYNETYYGYGFRAGSDGERLAIYVHLILRSSFARWWALMTSGEYGFEREVVEKATVDALPIPPLEGLSDEQISRFEELAKTVVTRAPRDRQAHEEWVASLYALSSTDREIKDDTLLHGMASDPIEPILNFKAFSRGLMDELAPWAGRLDSSLALGLMDAGAVAGWRFFALRRGALKGSPASDVGRLAGFVQAADATGTTEVYHLGEDGTMWVGMLARARYWTFSQGIRVARHLIWNHVTFVAGEGATPETSS